MRRERARRKAQHELQVRSLVNEERKMNGIIYLVGLVVVILAVLSFFGLR